MGGLTFHPALTGEVRFVFGRAVITHEALGALLYFKKMGEAFCVVVFEFISRLFLICFVFPAGWCSGEQSGRISKANFHPVPALSAAFL